MITTPHIEPRWSPKCQRFYTVLPTGCWRFLPTVATLGKVLMAQAFTAMLARQNAPRVQAEMIRAQGGVRTRELVTRQRAAANARAFFGPLGGAS